jgi:carbamoyl-phosphate synthase large subunit
VQNSTKTPNVAVTGLNATDNPAPGVGVLRSLAASSRAYGLVGLAYDALDPGIYAKDIVNDVFMLPYASSSPDAFFERVCHIHAQLPLDAIIPTLDAELPVFIELAPALERHGIATIVPTREQFEARSKANLNRFAQRHGFLTPETMQIGSIEELNVAEPRLRFPLFIKGPYYGAKLVTNIEEARAAFHATVAEWGYPILVQACVPGNQREERNLVGLGDGKGGLLGAVAMKKLAITDKGKAWAGVTIRDAELLRITERFVQATNWAGPFELEVMVTPERAYYLIEINPRFPAWVYLAASAGLNLPAMAVDFALGEAVPACLDYRVGTVFSRIALDQIASVSDLERMVVHGEWRQKDRVGRKA